MNRCSAYIYQAVKHVCLHPKQPVDEYERRTGGTMSCSTPQIIKLKANFWMTRICTNSREIVLVIHDTFNILQPLLRIIRHYAHTQHFPVLVFNLIKCLYVISNGLCERVIIYCYNLLVFSLISLAVKW